MTAKVSPRSSEWHGRETVPQRVVVVEAAVLRARREFLASAWVSYSEACPIHRLPSRFHSMFNVVELLRQHEGKTLEFKRDLSSPDKVMRSLVAFANGAGGVLLIGVEDGSRRVIGVADATRIEEQLASFISDRIEPRLIPEIHIMPWRKTHLLVVEVFPSSSRPHYVKAACCPAGVYVRVGSTNRRADAAAVAELQRVVRGRSFDEGPLPELNSEAIDFRAASECFAPARRLTRDDLHTLHLLATHQKREVPTVGGVLLFGRDRLKQFPDAWLRGGCFAVEDRSVIVDSTNITNLPVLAVEEALRFVQRNMRRALEVQGTACGEHWHEPSSWSGSSHARSRFAPRRRPFGSTTRTLSENDRYFASTMRSLTKNEHLFAVPLRSADANKRSVTVRVRNGTQNYRHFGIYIRSKVLNVCLFVYALRRKVSNERLFCSFLRRGMPPKRSFGSALRSKTAN